MTMDMVSLGTSIVGVLGRASLEGAVAVAIVALFVRFVPRLSPSFAAGLWWLACLKFALALVPLSQAPWAVPVPGIAPISAVAEDAGALFQEPVALDTRAHSEALLIEARAPRNTELWGSRFFRPTLSVRARTIAIAAAFSIWIVGALAWGALGVRSIVRARRWIREACVPEVADLDLGRRIAHSVGLAHLPSIRLSRSAPAPLLVSTGRSTVVLPERLWKELDASQRAMVLAHELVHVHRRDALTSWLPWLVECLFWFHPLAHVATREFAFARESACDDAVMRRLGEAPRRYGELLLRIGTSPRVSWAGIGVAPSLHSLRRRIVMLDRHDVDRGLVRGSIAIAIITLVTVIPLRFGDGSCAEAMTADDDDYGSTSTFHISEDDGTTTTAIWSNDDDEHTIALVEGEDVRMVGQVKDAKLARKIAKEMSAQRLLVMREDGEITIVDDPNALDSVGKIFGQLDDLSAKQNEFGALQSELGEKQEALGARQAVLGEKMEELGEKMAELQVELQRAIARDRDTDEIEAKIEEVGEHMAELGRAQGELGDIQGKLGAQQGMLGEKQGEIGRDLERRSLVMRKDLDAFVEELHEQGLTKTWEG